MPADSTQDQKPIWQRGSFNEPDTDPLTGFANIMDVMLVFALGLIIALVSQSQELQRHFDLAEQRQVDTGKELLELPESIKQGMNGQGMESLGQVYRDPATGKLILVGGQ